MKQCPQMSLDGLISTSLQLMEPILYHILVFLACGACAGITSLSLVKPLVFDIYAPFENF
jgi:hypothetical protein